MKLLGVFILCFAFLLVAAVQSSQAQEYNQQFNGDVYQSLMEGNNAANYNLVLSRHKRGTCSIHSSLCVAHCRVRGYKRGYCSSKGICTCRN